MYNKGCKAITNHLEVKMKDSYERDRKRDNKRRKRRHGHRSDGRGYLHSLNRLNNERSKRGK